MDEMNFWRGKRVLITGHTGFKGAWLSLWLSSLGANVAGYSLRPPTSPSLFQECKTYELMESFIGDICDLERLKAVIFEIKPEVVFHLAAQPMVLEGYRDPVNTYSTNIMGTINLLESIRASESVKAVVNITTDKCYENKEWLWGYRENESLGGRDPYSNSKACSELITAAYRESYFSSMNDDYPRIATARAGNVIGGGDWGKDRLIPDFIRAIMAKEKLKIRYPDAVRPWQHVLEPLRGYLLLANRLYNKEDSAIGAWNFGPSYHGEWSVRKVINQIKHLWGADAEWERTGTQLFHEANYLRLDSTKAKVNLGWEAVLSMEETVMMTVEWYKMYYNKEKRDVRAATLAQIEQYLTKIGQVG
ncbi:CDP-glucose 4,6-dehydratase [Anaeromusa acidaminophila]|uniref:CDP-glucose 4,6-dehydratase n=1 Tax=Anaeromusa acidaminophila TaxID=81464 RepID=UPI00037E2C5E|nr:CDP-glucose 4,6-dehydratase [Anaeromusa acidaminophila]